MLSYKIVLEFQNYHKKFFDDDGGIHIDRLMLTSHFFLAIYPLKM